MTTESAPPFGKLRSFLWPVYRHEFKIFIPMLLMFFLISLNYNILRTAKEALILTARASGAETLPFLKTWAILPMSLLLMVLFTRLSNRFNIERVFYLMMGLFLGFFLLFAVLIYPMHTSLHSHNMADKLTEMLPQGFHGLITVFRNWTFTLFYVMSELWGTAIMTVLFWGFANQITSVNAAKRFYALILLGGNLSNILSGEISIDISHLGLKLTDATGQDGWGHSLLLFSLVIFGVGLLTMAIFRWLNVYALQGDLSKSGFFNTSKEKSEIKMSMRKNFAYLAKSKYLICIAVIVVMYNVAINLTEVAWKDQLHKLYPNPNEMNAYLGRINEAIGIVSTTMALLCGIVIRRFNWTFGAMVPPFILLITGASFFASILYKDLGGQALFYMLGSSPLFLIVLFGSIQNCLCRASKYTFFDNTKELAFIPLSQESKLKGKAAIDGVGSRFGKSGSSIVYQCLLMCFGTISSTIPLVAVSFFIVIGAWMFAVRSLGRQFKELVTPKEEEKVPLPEKEEPEVIG